MYRHFANALLALLLGALAACSSSPSRDDDSVATKPEAQTSGKQTKTKSKSKDDAALPEVPAGPPPIPPEATQQFERALTLLGGGDLGPAEAEFKKLNATYPEYSGPLVNLGVIYLKSGKYAEAEKSLRAAIELSPMNAAAFNQLGIVYRNMGRFKDADTAYRQAISADPNYGLAHLNLGVLCDLYLQQPERALESFERYLQLVSNPDPKVNAWVKELRSRLGIKTPTAEPVAAPVPSDTPPPTAEATP
jgi:tetratricopeptide (TPR) repeat protein